MNRGDRPADLYRIYDADGALLYVGISWNAAARMSSHRATASWWRKAKTIEVTHYASRALAARAEAKAIKREKPLHNLDWSTTRPRPRPGDEILTAAELAERIGVTPQAVHLAVREGRLPVWTDPARDVRLFNLRECREEILRRSASEEVPA